MVRGQKKSLNGIELFLCPFENLYITQGPNENYSHKGIMAWDVSGTPQESYFAPATSKCVKIYPESGQSMWQTIGNVRCPNGYVGPVTYMIVHDNDISDLYVGKVVNQGDRLGEFGDKGNATGSHCHIEFSQSGDTSWFLNQYKNYMFNNEVDPEDVCFMDNTNILKGIGNWRYTDSLYIGNPIERDTNKEQLKVFVDKFYPTGRKEPMGYISGFVKAGYYNILETKEQNNLIWYKIDNDLWFDFGSDWCEVLKKEEVATNEDKVEIQELKNQVYNLIEEKRELTDANNAKDELLKALNKKIEVLENRIVEVTEERDKLISEQPTLIFTCTKTAAYQIKLYENEKLFIA